MQKLMQEIKSFFDGFDKPLFFLSLFSSVYGLLMVYSATKRSMGEGDLIPSEMRTMLIAVLIGVIICLAISYIDYNLITKLWPLYVSHL